MRKRLIAVMTAMAVLFAGLCVRLYRLSQSELQAASEQQSTRRETIAVSRGTIYDRYLQPLVNEEEQIVASVSPFPACVARIEQTLSGRYRTQVCEQLSQGERVRVELEHWLAPTVGITQVSAPIRYSQEALACHVIGYVNGENSGVSGIEKSFDELLSSFGGEAAVSYPIDALGRVSSDSEDVLDNTLDRAIGGVALTLDRQIQSLVQREAAAYLERGAVLVTDAASGEVLASVSLPLYDQNEVDQVLGDAASPLLDRTRINYNCGSVFKIITAAAALESGLSVDTTFTCRGSVTVSGVTFHCHNPLGDGAQTMREAMSNSCNCYFIELALKTGASAIYDLAVRAGFDKALTLTSDMDTAVGLLPSRRDLSADAALANFAIGQGDLLLTPYHIASLLQAVAADGVLTAPTLLYGTVDEHASLTQVPASPDTTRLFSQKTAAQLKEMLASVVESGTGTSAKPQQGTAAGKTGTAETGWEIDGKEVVQSWFAGVYPVGKPQYVITILSENGGVSGKTAAPLFAAIADALFEAGLVDLS